MAIVATPIDDPSHGRGERLSRRNESYAGERWYKINTRRLAAAYTAAGLPLPGTAFDAIVPKCVARDYDPGERGGVDNASGEGGYTFMRVGFSDGGGGGQFKTVTHGTRFTAFEPSVQSAQVVNGVFDLATDPPINGGEGVVKDVGTMAAKVHTYARDESGVDLPRLAELQNEQAVNDSPITLPPLYNGTRPWVLAVGQARYHSLDMDFESGLVRVTHTLLLAPDHKARWRQQNDKGYPVGPEQTRLIYRPMDLAGLW
ncbi:MAG: hypothetical protein AB7O32_00220 [Vicinamibacterales bacterium]